MRTVLLTGARGFIGRHCLERLRAAGVEVYAVSSAAPAGGDEGVIWHQADLRDPQACAALVRRTKPDAVLHLAWITTPHLYWHSPENLRWAEATLALIRQSSCCGARRFVGAGSCAEYEWNRAVLAEGDRDRGPATLYGACKGAVQQILERFVAGLDPGREAMTAAWGRLFFLYGPGEHPDRLVPSVIRSLLAGQTAACTSGEQERDFLYVADAADAFVRLLRSEVQGPVNIASGSPVTVRTVAERIGAIIGRPDLIALGARPLPAGEPLSIAADVRRLRDEVGWVPRHDLDDGLRRSIEWWRSAAAAAAAARPTVANGRG